MKTLIIYEGSVITELPNLYKNDFGQVLEFHIINEDTSAVDLTDYSITMKVINIIDNSILFSKACTVTSVTSGYCAYTFADGDLSDSGSFRCELELSKSSVKETINLGYLNLLEDL